MSRRVLLYSCAIFFVFLPRTHHVEAAGSLERVKSFVSRLARIVSERKDRFFERCSKYRDDSTSRYYSILQGRAELTLKSLSTPYKTYEKTPLSVVYEMVDNGTKCFVFWNGSNKIATLEVSRISVSHDGGGPDGTLMTLQYTDESSTCLTYYLHFKNAKDFECFSYLIESRDF